MKRRQFYKHYIYIFIFILVNILLIQCKDRHIPTTTKNLKKIKTTKAKLETENRELYYTIKILDIPKQVNNLLIELYQECDKPSWFTDSLLISALPDIEKKQSYFLYNYVSNDTIYILLHKTLTDTTFYTLKNTLSTTINADNKIGIESVKHYQEFIVRLIGIQNKKEIAASEFIKLPTTRPYMLLVFNENYYEEILTFIIILFMLLIFMFFFVQFLKWDGMHYKLAFIIASIIFIVLMTGSYFIFFEKELFLYGMVCTFGLSLIILFTITSIFKNRLIQKDLDFNKLPKVTNYSESDLKRKTINNLISIFKNQDETKDNISKMQKVEYIMENMSKQNNFISNTYDVLRWAEIGTNFYPMIGFGGTVIGLIIKFSSDNQNNDTFEGLGLALFTTLFGIVLGAICLIIEGNINIKLENFEQQLIKWQIENEKK